MTPKVPGMCKDGAPGLFDAASLPRMADSMTARARSAREAADAYIASLEGEGTGR